MVSFGGLFFFLWVCNGLLLVVSTPCANADHVLEDACSDAEQSSSFVQMRATSGLKQHQVDVKAGCCKYITEYGMAPGKSWGKTPSDKKPWYKDNNCDKVVGGPGGPNCVKMGSLKDCCRYNSEYGMNPTKSWGKTPESEKSWYRENSCDEVMGGAGAPSCKATEANPVRLTKPLQPMPPGPMMRPLAPPGGCDPGMKKAVEKADANKDGKATPEELKTIAPRRISLENIKSWDEDGDGFISCEEMTAGAMSGRAPPGGPRPLVDPRVKPLGPVMRPLRPTLQKRLSPPVAPAIQAAPTTAPALDCDACFAKFDTPAVNGCKIFNLPGIGQKTAVKIFSKVCPNSKECEAQLASRCGQGPEPTAAPPTVPPTAAPVTEPPAPPTEAPTAAPTIAIQRAILPGPTPVPAPTAPPPPPANAHPDSYPVFPVNCSVHGKPIQMAKTDGGFSAHQLDIETGGYTPIFDVKWTDMKGMFSDLNACGINPFDDIIYCIMNAALKSYIVRLSPGRIAFVATLRPETYNTGGFGPKGRYYVATHVGKFTVINNVHGMIGYKDQFDTGIPSLSKLPMLQPAGWYNTADVVVVTQDFDGTGAEDYLMSLTGKRLQIAKWDGTKFSGSWIIPTATGNWKADTWGENYGAGWSFEGKCFFAANSGAGVYQIPLDKIDINSKTPISLSRVGSSEFGEDSDGLNCMSQPDPWITNVRPFDCKVHRDAPIQIMKGSFGYGVKKLSLTTGELTDLYSIPYTYTNPPFENLNAAGINPLDKIVYGCMLMAEAPGPMYIVRFDSTRVEFVAKLQGSFDPIGGTFDTNGRFYFISYPETNFKGYIMAVDGLDQMKGYNMPNATGITDITKDTLSIQLGETMQIADIVTISYPDKENKSVDHIIGVNRDQELVVINWKGAQTKVHELNTNNVLEKVGGDHGSKLNWGAAWNYEGRLIFASNDGVGVFEAKEFKDNIGYLILEKVVPSNTVWDTDGFNCPLSSPFMGYEQNPVIAKMIQYNW